MKIITLTTEIIHDSICSEYRTKNTLHFDGSSIYCALCVKYAQYVVILII